MKNYFSLFVRRVLKDLKQKHLLQLKLLFFLHSSTIAVLYPYLTIHMRELGINVEETAIMSSVLPFLAILMPPFSGMLADKIGNFRTLLAGFSFVGGLSALLLLLVPVGRVMTIYPEKLLFSMSCAANQTLKLTLSEDSNCSSFVNNNNTQFNVEACGIACNSILTDFHVNSLHKAELYEINIYDIKTNSTKSYLYSSKGINKLYFLESKSLSKQELKNFNDYTTSITQISKNVFFFPTKGLFNFSCLNQYNKSICYLGTKTPTQFHRLFEGNIFYGVAISIVKSDADDTENLLYFHVKISDNILNCSEGFMKSGQHVSVSIPLKHNHNHSTRHLDLGSCAPRCLITTPRKNICANDKTVKEFNMRLTFWSYLIARVVSGILSGISFAMFEGAAIAILREHKADYGLQRIYATFGGMISSPLSGFLVDFTSKGKSYTDFSPIFYLYATLKMTSAVLILFINLEFKKPAENVLKEVWTVLKNIELIFLYVACLAMGSAWGFIESFLFWLLQDLGGSKSLMGLTITVGGLVGIPLLVLSGPIIKKIGHANVILIGFVFYTIRLLGYSLIFNPWLCLIFEAMESITIGLSFTAAVTYAAKLSTSTTDTTIQGLLGGIYYGFGKGVGSFVGGYLIKSFGTRITFQLFAIFTTLVAVFYFLVHYFYMKRKSKGKEEQESVSNLDKDLSNKGHNDTSSEIKNVMVNAGFEETEQNIYFN